MVALFAASNRFGGSKYNALPAIPYDNTVAKTGSFRPANFNSDGETSAERLRQLEVRVHIAERSNQALLEELVRTQNELRVETRRTEEQIRNEQAARSQIENTLRLNGEKINQIGSRLMRADEQLNEGRLAVSTLATHLRGVEQTTVNGSMQAVNQRDMLVGRVDNMASQLEESLQARNHTERTVYQLSSELQQIRSRLEAHASDVATLSTEFKNKSLKLEQENRLAVDGIRRSHESVAMTDKSTQQLKALIDQRLVEMRDAFVDLRGKYERNEQETRLLGQQIAARFAELQTSTADDGRRRDEVFHTLELSQRERDRVIDVEHTQLNKKLTDMTEETGRRLAQCEMKLREEYIEKCAHLEKVLIEDRDSRKKFEKTSKDENEQMWIAFKKLFDDEMKRMRDAHVADFRKNKENLSKLNEAIDLMERHLEEQKKNLERLMAAEITLRQQQERQFGSRLNDIEEKFSSTSRNLQDTVGILSGKINSESQMHDTLLADITAKQLDQSRTLDDVQTQIRALTSVADNGDKYDILRLEIESRAAAEAENRKRDVDSLQVQLVKRTEADSRDRDENRSRVLELQDTVNKLSETVESLKSALGIKIQNEEKQRVRDVQHLQDEIESIRTNAGRNSQRERDIQRLQNDIDELRASMASRPSARGTRNEDYDQEEGK